MEQIAKKPAMILYRSFQLSVPLFILFNFIAFTSHAQSFVDAKQSGKDLANSLLIQVQNNAQQDINNKNTTTGTSVAESINFKGTDIPEKNYTNENMDAAKNQKAADKDNVEASIVSTSFLRMKEYPISLSDSFLDKANDAQKNPENYVDCLSGKYTDCNQEGGEEVLSKSSHTCDEYQEIKDNTCLVGRSIEVDGKHKYKCPRKLNKFEKTCTKSLVVAFDKQENCNAGIIEYIGVPSSTVPLENGQFLRDSSYIWKVSGGYNYPALTVNIVYDNAYDHKWFHITKNSKKIFFNVKDKSRISSFVLNKMAIKGVISVSLNGNLLLSAVKGPYTVASDFRRSSSNVGGSYVYYVNGIALSTANNMHATTTTATDLLPYIKDGSNEIVLDGVPARSQAIEAKQVCLTEKESWLEQCSGAGS